ncbi:MAG TPA: autotransporter domain-containing protein [Parachlamydiaceae bacterium]|nr:autotransporter domain-containing protein [Parachlamydiaceae bacterium]
MNKWSHIFLACLSLTTIANTADAVFSCNGNDTSLLLFGDSYFDTGAGNAVSAQFGVPLVSPTPTSAPPGPYFNGRHSNGPIWVDYVSAALDLPVENYAVAGSTTGAFNTNTPPSPNPIGGLFQQLQRFAATGRQIGENEIVILDGAGNDFLSLVPAGLNVPAVQATATQALTNLGKVVLPGLEKLGAKTIVLWNLGDLSQLPLFNSPVFAGLNNPLVRQLMQGASTGYNAALGPVVQQLNTDIAREIIGVRGDPQIFIFDAFTAFNETLAILRAQGVDVTQFSWIPQYGGPYLPNPLLPAGTDPNSLAFYDPVHPTSNAWEIFSGIFYGYLDTLINAPRFAAAAVDLALETAAGHRDLVDNHFRIIREQRYLFNDCCDNCSNNCKYCNDYNSCDGYNSCDNIYAADSNADCASGCQCDRFQAYGSVEGRWGSTQTRKGNYGLNYDTALGMLGLDYRLSQTTILGSSFTYQHSHAKIKEGRGKMDLDDYIPTAYVSYLGPCYFADVSSTIHFYQFGKIKRNIPFADRTAKAHTHGCAMELTFDAGYVGRLNCLTYVPLIGLSFENLVISDYRERNAGMLNLRANRQYQRSCIGRIGGQVFYKLFDDRTVAFAEIIYQHEFLRDGHRMGLRFINSNDNAIIHNQSCPVERESIKYSFGLDAKFCNIMSSISYIGETNFKQYTNAIRAEVDYAF